MTKPFKPLPADQDFWEKCAIAAMQGSLSDGIGGDVNLLTPFAFETADRMTKERRKRLYPEPNKKISDYPEPESLREGDEIIMPDDLDKKLIKFNVDKNDKWIPPELKLKNPFTP